MSLYVVTYTHPDQERWAELLEGHLNWIQRRLDEGTLVASGPLEDVEELSAILLIAASDRAHVDELFADDPFVSEGLVTRMDVVRWNPGFGALSGFAGAS